MYSPWGPVEQSTPIISSDLLWVSTAGHGGLMVTKAFAEKHLSAAARKRGEKCGDYVCFEEDCAWQIAAFELKSPYRERLLDDDTGVIREQYDRNRLLEALSFWYADYLIEIGEKPVEPQYARFRKKKLSDHMRKNKHHNLIVCVSTYGPGVIKVWTADGKEHFVTTESYHKRDLDINLLSNCQVI